MDSNTDKNITNYSVVVPVYNSEASLRELCHRIKAVFEKIGQSYEIILVDDSSVDNSWDVMIALREKNKNAGRLFRKSKTLALKARGKCFI